MSGGWRRFPLYLVRGGRQNCGKARKRVHVLEVVMERHFAVSIRHNCDITSTSLSRDIADSTPPILRPRFSVVGPERGECAQKHQHDERISNPRVLDFR